MSAFVPNPSLVVEALRNHHVYHYQKPPKPLLHDDVSCEVDEALSHAEAIAEMWDWTMPQAAAVQELIAAAKGLEDDLGFPGPRHARLRAALEAVSA